MESAMERQAGHGYRGNDTYIGSPMGHVAEDQEVFALAAMA
ncbi:MAG: hypothetical protein P8Y12_10630 [Gammaproteobacteria bacterium]|jgi:hypothetical protein